MILHDIIMSEELFTALYDATGGGSPTGLTGGYTPSRRVQSTDLNIAISTGVAIVRESPYFGDRQVINIIGDGVDNIGGPSDAERDLAYEEFGIMINGLVMTTEARDYYDDHVITPNGFTILVPDYPSFSKAMEEKFRDEMVYLLESIEKEYEHG